MAQSPEKNSGSVLLIEDNPDLIKVVRDALVHGGYAVTSVSSSRPAFQFIFKSPPNVIILDINLPDLDGFHIAKELKRNMMFRHIPLIVLSNRIDFLDKMRSLDVIMDEYLVKPIDAKDLLLRTQLVVERAESNLDANPLTHLPGNIAIMRAVNQHIASGKPYAIGYADLNNFKAFNDKYGFSDGDNVIKYTAKMLVTVLERMSPSDHFVGHIGGDDFVFTCAFDKATDVAQKVTEEFDRGIGAFYSPEDRKNGYVVVEDRRGIVSQVPLVSIAVGVASDDGGKFTNLGQINHSLTQLKKYAKSFHGSAFVRDRRNLNAGSAEFTWGPTQNSESNQVLEELTDAIGSYLPKQLEDVIKAQTITVLFQPVLDMRTDEIVGHESFVRGPAGTPLEFPDALFQTARTAGLVLRLDQLCLKKIIAAAGQLHRGLKLFINIYPETLLERGPVPIEIFSGLIKNSIDVILELTGANRANDPLILFSELAQFKERGFKVSVEALSPAQEQGFEYLMDLRPDFIKLNMVPYKDMVNDFLKQEAFHKTVALIRQTGAEVICTKVESRSDSYLALKAGVTLGQGYLFARPTQIPQNKEKPNK